MNVCLFDIDGTLLSSGGAGKAAMEAALATEFGVQRPIDQVQMSGRTDRAIARDEFLLHGVADTAENFARFIRAYLSHLPGMLASRRGRVLPGIAGLLDSLSQAESVVGLLTGNVAQGAQVKLSHFGIAGHFRYGAFGDQFISRDEVAHDALRQTRERFGPDFDAARIWVIGDTPLDVMCARAIGARAVAVATGVHTLAQLEAASPDLLLADFSDAGPLLARLA
ncbi:MAG: HAD family hydrolase [Planctomycetia bacterium]|nr:HAD family hydrolase [Planctomycetia bacterium]